MAQNNGGVVGDNYTITGIKRGPLRKNSAFDIRSDMFQERGRSIAKEGKTGKSNASKRKTGAGCIYQG